MSIQVYFYAPRTFTARNPSDPLRAIEASGTYKLNKAGEAKIVLPLSELSNLPVGYPTIQELDIATAVYDGQIICSFTMYEAPKFVGRATGSVVELTGHNFIADLANFLHFYIIGAYYDFPQRHNIGTYPGQVELACHSLAKAGAPRTQLVQRFHEGEDTMTVADSSGFKIGDRIGVGFEDDSGGEGGHHSVIETVGPGYIRIEESTPKTCYNGNWVEVVSAQKGDMVRLTLAAGGYFYARIANDPIANTVLLDTPVTGPVITPDDPWSNPTVRIYNPRDPLTTNDILEIMGPAISGSWTLNGNTSSEGSALDPSGANVLQMLITVAEGSGDFFRLEQADASVPEYTLSWKTSPDSSGFSLITPGVATARTEQLSGNKILAETFQKKGASQYTSAVTPVSEDVDLSLVGPPSSPYNRTYNRGAWVIYHEGLEAVFSAHKQVNFDSIKPASQSQDDKVDAASRLQQAAIDYIADRMTSLGEYQASGHIPGEINIGQSVPTLYSETNWNEDTTLYITAYKHQVRGDGPRITSLTLSDVEPRVLITGLDRQIRNTSGQLSGSVSSSLSGGSAPGGDGGDGDSDLSGYLKADGSVPLRGNLPVDTGITIDGVDISEHANDPHAHGFIQALVKLIEILAGPNIDIKVSLRLAGSNDSAWYLPNAIPEETYITTYEIGLAKRVQVEEVLRMAPGASFEIYDEAVNKFRRLLITERDGNPHLEFAEPSEWTASNIDFTMTENGVNVVEVFELAIVTFTNITEFLDSSLEVLTSNWSLHREGWDTPEVYLDTDSFTRVFDFAGIFTITLTVQYLNTATSSIGWSSTSKKLTVKVYSN